MRLIQRHYARCSNNYLHQRNEAMKRSQLKPLLCDVRREHPHLKLMMNKNLTSRPTHQAAAEAILMLTQIKKARK